MTVRRVLPVVVVFFRGGQLGVVSGRTRDVLIGEFSVSSSRMRVGAAGRRGVIERRIHKAGREQHGAGRLAGRGLVAGVLDIAGKWRSYRSLATGYLFSAASGRPPGATGRSAQVAVRYLHAARPPRRCHHRIRGAGMTGVFLPGKGGVVVFPWQVGRRCCACA